MRTISKEVLDKVSLYVKVAYPFTGQCKATAQYAKTLLKEFGNVETTLVKGSACWRVGTAKLALISYIDPKYLPYGTYYECVPNPDGSYHYWLETDNGMILDFTTFNFSEMMIELDAKERCKKPTPVTWNPNYLYVHKNTCVSTYKVLNGKTSKLYFYKAD